jgi:hypothetical protein
MVKALARAFRWRKMLDEGVHATLEDLARAKGVHATYVSRVLRLTLLAPDIVEAILDGRQPAELQLDKLLVGLPLDWRRQRCFSKTGAHTPHPEHDLFYIGRIDIGPARALDRRPESPTAYIIPREQQAHFTIVLIV